ncbi:unnamed protein product [Orchesella dallaii]|uniref:Uncharacterized protein n=1 Tax=Orchesella dallaii TaxID=48710 RepID=A0ABP1REZ3_9HEXA
MVHKLPLSTNLLVLSFSLLVHLAWQIEATKSKPIDNMIEASKNKRVTSLSCHVCHSETNDDCFRFNESSVGFPASCGGDFTMCMVSESYCVVQSYSCSICYESCCFLNSLIFR